MGASRTRHGISWLGRAAGRLADPCLERETRKSCVRATSSASSRASRFLASRVWSHGSLAQGPPLTDSASRICVSQTRVSWAWRHGFWPHGSPSHSPRSQGPGLTFFCLTGVVSWISPLGCFVGPAQLCLGETFLGKLFLARVSLRGNSSWRNSSWPHFAWPRFARDDTFLL